MTDQSNKAEKTPSLVRVAKFPIYPTPEQTATLQKVADNQTSVWNRALEERKAYFEAEIKPFIEARKLSPEDSTLKEGLKVAYQKAPNHFSQCKLLTDWRRESNDFSSVPCSWQQETLKILEGSFSSFTGLRRNGDTTAHPPRPRAEDGFSEIQGLGSWQLVASTLALKPQKPLGEVHQQAVRNSVGLKIVLSPGKVLPGGVELCFAVPDYQRLILSQAVKLCKFTLSRNKKGTFSVSVAYLIPKPEQVQLVPEEVVFVALGSSYIGVVSPKGEETIDLWRPDYHWMLKIAPAKERLKNLLKGSRAWKRRVKAVDRMYEIMRLQQLQNQREVIVRKLRHHGVHFVVLEHSPIRGKKGRLADKSKDQRRGELGLNWSVQNTGSLARLKQLLEQKAAEWGGSVSTLRLEQYPLGGARERKVPAAKAARTQYLNAA